MCTVEKVFVTGMTSPVNTIKGLSVVVGQSQSRTICFSSDETWVWFCHVHHSGRNRPHSSLTLKMRQDLQVCFIYCKAGIKSVFLYSIRMLVRCMWANSTAHVFAQSSWKCLLNEQATFLLALCSDWMENQVDLNTVVSVGSPRRRLHFGLIVNDVG